MNILLSIKSLLKFEIKFITEMGISLLGLLVVLEVLLGPIVLDQFYIEYVVSYLNNKEGLIAILILVFLYTWANDKELKNV